MVQKQKRIINTQWIHFKPFKETIAYIKIEFDSAAYAKYAQIIVGDKVVTGTDGVYEINGSTFTVYNNNESNTGESNQQVRFQSITIYYTVAGE